MLALKLGESLPSNNAPAISPNTYSIQTTGTEYVTNDGAAAGLAVAIGSISVWTKVSTMGASGTLFRIAADGSNFIQILYHAASNEMRFAYRGGATSKTAVITDAIENDGKWYHILGTWSTDLDELKIYLNGVLKDTNTDTLGEFAGTPSLFDIGQNTGDANFYKGYISEFAFFSSIVSVSDVYIANQQPVNLTGMSGLEGYWKFNNGSGTLAHDSSGNRNTGTLVNSPTWTTDTP
tara:strand:+ start:781 stop:1488 length:708 start_codon:yes stop_codon:yes gene_type:complete